ncbi:hypothetical protein OSTOST_05628, partial [Ostertagia ostertagi]
MNDFRKKLSGYREKILQSLHLSKEQRNELVERLKMLKRKTIDKVLPTGDTIEEINEIAIFQTHYSREIWSLRRSNKNKFSRPFSATVLSGKLRMKANILVRGGPRESTTSSTLAR